MSGKAVRLILIATFAVLFLIGLIAANKADAVEHDVMVGLGAGIVNIEPEYRSQTIGYRYDRKWAVEIARTGEADTRKDTTLDSNWRANFSRYVHFREGRKINPFLKFGACVYRDAPRGLVDDELMFDLGVGVELWLVAQLRWQHCSTADRSEPNSGIDEFQLNFVMRF